jgi:sulfatase maturation enzyme AslB (radical SAM superfamily)
LDCDFCYQDRHDTSRLASNLPVLLEPWLSEAHEFTVIGGEPFFSKECLDWIKWVDTSRCAKLGLAAVTNGLLFTKSTLELIASKRWNWIMVSIDAASALTYKRVRGGDFKRLLTGLDALTQVRATLAEPFELRFGYMLHRNNLAEARTFVDFCHGFGAMPQFTVVSGDWHSDGVNTSQDRALFEQALTEVREALTEHGFDPILLRGAENRASQIVLRRKHSSNSSI